MLVLKRKQFLELCRKRSCILWLLFRETQFSSANRLRFFGGKTVLDMEVGYMALGVVTVSTLATIVVKPNMSNFKQI